MSKKVIRGNVFETNSSSQHACCVTTNDTHVTHEELMGDEYTDETLWIHDDGRLYLYDVAEGFGRWPFKILTSFRDKLKYALCEYLGGFYGDEPEYERTLEWIKGIVKEVVPEFTDFDMRKKCIGIYYDEDGNILTHDKLDYSRYDEETGESVYIYKDENGNDVEATFDWNHVKKVFDIGSIDHQSVGLLRGFLEKKGIDLKEFLTNKRFLVVIDGDEYNDLNRYIKSGIIDMKFVQEIYPKRE